MNNYFIAVYTNEVKDYCDAEFFTRIDKILRPGSDLWVVDNSTNPDYLRRLNELLPSPAIHLPVPIEPKRTQFLRNVTESVNILRHMFLNTTSDYFLIIESDVKPPENLLEQFDKTIELLENAQSEINLRPWGIIGARYYQGFHDYSIKGTHPTHHCLSGCTVYKRELIESTPFRWSSDNFGAFPDAWMSVDAQDKGYNLFNNYDIQCEHLSTPRGGRQSKPL